MKIKIFKLEEEYYKNNDFDFDFFVTYFPVKKKPMYNIPILRLITSYEDAKKIGFSTFAATNGWVYENFPNCENHEIESFCKRYLDGDIDLKLVPNKLQRHDVIFLTKELQQKRVQICSSCPYNKENLCELCGCDLIKKVRYKKEKCPINNWAEENYSNLEHNNFMYMNIAVAKEGYSKDCGCKNG